MVCTECGAILPGDETCRDRFHALLAAEVHNTELMHVHGLTVLTYHLQHPSLTKPWYQAAGYDLMRRMFEPGRDWQEVLMAGQRQGTAQREAARWKQSYGSVMPPEVVTEPVAGEMTVADIDPEAPSGQGERVVAWARSVAEGRVRSSGLVGR
jgi:hypothetical protein